MAISRAEICANVLFIFKMFGCDKRTSLWLEFYDLDNVNSDSCGLININFCDIGQ